MFDDGNAIEDDDVLDISSQINNIDLRSAFGYIGQDTLMIEESSISLDFFANSFSGDIEFASPEFNFFIKNSYGVPVEVDLSGIKGYQENSPDTTYLNFTGGVNPFAINYPTLDNMNEFEKTTISINSDNSNLSELLAAKPEVVTFKSFAHSNPDGPSDSYNFVTDQSRFDVNYEVVLPLWFRTDGFELKDTMDMDLEDAFGDVNMLKELITTLEVNNGLPVDLDIQLYFLDENYVMIDSLFTGTNQYLITGANVDANGEVVSANNSAPKVTLDEDRVDKLENVKKAIFSAGFRTSDFNQDTKVKFYSDYSLSFKMYMDVTTDID
jgi:hypothetical protein